MKYNKKELDIYKQAKAELNTYKTVIAVSTIGLFIGSTFFVEKMGYVIGALLTFLTLTTARWFIYDPTSKITSLVDKAINDSAENISNDL